MKCKLLAFLLCDSASRGSDGKVTLHGLFNRIIAPRTAASPRLFFVFYKIVVKQPCTVALRVIDLDRNIEVPGNWRDSIGQLGPIQSIWALTTTLFKQPGRYAFELTQESDGSKAVSLAAMLLVVDQEGE